MFAWVLMVAGLLWLSHTVTITIRLLRMRRVSGWYWI